MPPKPPAFPKVFFILPMTRYAPDDYIRLGQVVADPLAPWDRLIDPIPLTGALEPRTTATTEWFCRSTSSSFTSVGVFARVLDLLTAEASRSAEAGRAQTWEAARLETVFFEPGADKGLAEKLVKDPEVKKHLNRIRWLGGSAYLITGLKIVRSPGKFTTVGANRTQMAAKLAAAVDGGQAPGGVKVGGESNKSGHVGVNEEGTPEGDYVFAYRMQKIYVTWLTGKAVVGKMREGGDLEGVREGRGYDSGRGGDDDWEGSDPGDYQSDFGAVDGEAGDEADATDWDIKNAEVEAEDFRIQLPREGFETEEVGDEEETYYLVRATGRDIIN
ncbi:CS1 fimbrial subunit A [Madurella mycetomatis]|uniref:CS1 fimbrial subunit A n=1 Tax=Madurella mycetomatis TaxID=100816 RepID=A0A175W3W0_9PEZI|nr:CS1 fimbrial subunit A [Madurella mycetomatis]